MESSVDPASWQALAAEFARLGYEIVDCLARTAGSIVLKAKQSIVERDVIIKIYGGELDRAEPNILRFEKEAKLLAAFDHPNIVKLYGTGRLQDGRPFMVMEYLPGTSLLSLLNSGMEISEKRVRLYAGEICQALSYAHSRKVIHRDIKPGNIMVLNEGSIETLKLLDFGIHKSLHQTNQNLTATSATPGTANYMSPEQCKGEALDARSDIYALGCVLYELCSGEPPMVAETDWLIMSNHLNKKLKTVASRSKISRSLEQTILRCLEKDPAKRPASADEVIRILAQHNEGADPHSNWSKRALATAAFLMLIIGVAVCFYQLDPSKRSSSKKGQGQNTKPTPRESWEQVRRRADCTAQEWQELCRNWLLAHYSKHHKIEELTDCIYQLDSPNGEGMEAALSSLYKKSKEKLAPKSLTYRSLLRQSNTIQLWQELDLQLAIEILRKSWKASEDTLARMASIPNPKKYSPLDSRIPLLFRSYLDDGQYGAALHLARQYGDMISDSKTRADFYAFAATTAGLEQNQPLENTFIEKALAEYLKSTGERLTKDDWQFYANFCILLTGKEEYSDIAKLARVHPPELPIINADMESTYLSYAQAFLQLGEPDRAEKLLKALSSPAENKHSSAQGLLEVCQLHLAAALKRKDRALIRARALKLISQLSNQSMATCSFNTSYLKEAWLSDPELASACLKEAQSKAIANNMGMANVLTGYAHRIRERNELHKALKLYELAQKYYDYAGSYFEGRMTAFNGETICHLQLNDIAGARKCAARARSFEQQHQSEAGICPDMYLLENQILRHEGKYAACIEKDKQLLNELLKQAKRNPKHYMQAVNSLVYDYLASKQVELAKETIKKYVTYTDKNDKVQQPFILELEKLCKQNNVPWTTLFPRP